MFTMYTYHRHSLISLCVQVQGVRADIVTQSDLQENNKFLFKLVQNSAKALYCIHHTEYKSSHLYISSRVEIFPEVFFKSLYQFKDTLLSTQCRVCLKPS